VQRKTVTFTLLWVLAGALKVFGETSEQIWVDYNPSWWPAEGIELFGDVGARTEIGNDEWWRFVVRPSVGFPTGRFRIAAGIGNFFTVNNVINDRWELRPFQGVSTVWPKGRFSLEHYLRLEERFDFNTGTWNSLNSLRLRYQLLASYRWSAHQTRRQWSVVGIAEPFVKLAGDEGLQREQFRITAGLQRDVGEKGSVRFEFSWQQETLFFSPSGTIDEFFLRLRIFR